MSENAILSVRGVTKTFPGVKALDEVSAARSMRSWAKTGPESPP